MEMCFIFPAVLSLVYKISEEHSKINIDSSFVDEHIAAEKIIKLALKIAIAIAIFLRQVFSI